MIAAKISSSDYYILDSMPLEICKLSRSGRSKICKEDFETSPNKGYCATQQLNYYGYKKQDFIFRKSRKRIETLFSQLCDQFMIRRNYAKSFERFKNRILSKIMALTVIQMMNKINNKNINNLKICID